MTMQKSKSGLIALSFLFAISASAAAESNSITVDVTLGLGQKTTVVVSCDRIANRKTPDLKTLTTLDSALHRYEGDMYYDTDLRQRVLDMIIKKQPSETARAMAKRVFAATYEPFDNAASDQKRMNYLGKKLEGHGVKVGDILRQCNL